MSRAKQECVEIRDVPVELSWQGSLLRMSERESAPSLRIVTDVDAPGFEAAWLDGAVRASQRSA